MLLVIKVRPIQNHTMNFSQMFFAFSPVFTAFHSLIICFLRSLGQSYRLLCQGRRAAGGDGREQKVAGFAPLIELLRQLPVQLLIAVGEEGTQALQAAADQALLSLRDARNSMSCCNGLIGQLVGAFAQCSAGREMDSLDELPEDIRRRIADRDLLCSKLSGEVTVLLQGLLQAVFQQLQEEIPSMDRLAALVSETERKDAEWEQAIESARESMRQYNVAIGTAGPSLGLMGSFATGHPTRLGQGASPETALADLDQWAKRFLGDDAFHATDKAITDLNRALTDSEGGCVTSLLGLNQDQPFLDKELLLERCFDEADKAIASEHLLQSTDPLSNFPCTALLLAGQKVMQEWRGKAEGLKHAFQVCRMLNAALLESESLAGDGALARTRRDTIQALKSAKEEHRAATLVLQTTVLFQGKEDLAMAMGFPAVPALDESRRRVQAASAELRRATLKLTGELQGFFPEAILFIGQGLPAELGALWQPAQTLDAFDEKHAVAVASRNPVWRVRDGDAWFAVKEYRLSRPESLRTCLKEAAIIHRYRHHAVVELRGLFQDARGEGGAFYIQMPWYEHGTLDQWAGGGQLPEWYRVRAVLLDALQGLTHLHSGGVIHGDIKPANILVDARERGRLADFDVSVDTGQRTSAAWMTSVSTAAATARGFTAGFQAPELAAAGRATRATDMFALGRTVEAVRLRCEPDPSGAVQQEALGSPLRRVAERARGQTSALVQALTAAEPCRRPNAEDAAKMAFFVVLEDVCQREARACLLCELGGDGALHPAEGGGLACAEGHFHCRGCLRRLTSDLLKAENGGLRERREGRVMCCRYPTECRAPGFLDGELAALLPAEDAQAYLGARIEVLQVRARATLEEQLRQELAEELRRLAGLDARERQAVAARRHIEEEILQMRCPRAGCRRAFLDFDGCFAVSCGACPCKFCGWCLRDCGDADAHAHCRACPRVPRGANALFPGAGAFELAHRDRCREKVAAYLRGLDEETRQGVHRALQPRLRELGLP